MRKNRKPKRLLHVILPVLIALLMAVCMSTGAVAAEENPALSLPAFTSTECEWDADGNLLSETAFDLDGNPAVNSRGFHRAEYVYSEQGNLLSETFTGLNGEPVDADGGYAIAEYTYATNSRGEENLVAEDRYAADGTRAVIPGGYSFRRDTWEGDQIRATEYFDADGNPVQPTGGFAKILYDVQDEDGYRVITKTYQAADGSSLIGTEGGAKVVFKYAKDLNAAVNARVNEMDLGMALPSGGEGDALRGDLPTSSNGAISPADSSYGLMPISTEIFGVDGTETFGANRWHKEIRSYDERGNLTRIDYLGTDGEPMISAKGYASVVNTYDAQNRVIQIDYLDREENLVKMINGYARVTYEYYGGGGLHYERYFGADGERTMITPGMSMIEYEYDGGDFDLRVTYYDILDQYTMVDYGYARIEYKYEGPGGEDGELWKISPDAEKWQKYYGTDMKLIERKAGNAGFENFRNEYGQIIRTVYMDDTWHPTRNEEAQFAWVEYTYAGTDPEEPAITEAYFDKDGNPCEGATGAYARGMVCQHRRPSSGL